MMAALAGVVKEDDKDIARKMFRAGDINKQVDEVSKLYINLGGSSNFQKNWMGVWNPVPKTL